MLKKSIFQSVSLALPTYLLAASAALAEAPFPIPDMMQTACHDSTAEIDCPAAGEAFYGRDAQYQDPQRSDSKASDPADYPEGEGPQGMRSAFST